MHRCIADEMNNQAKMKNHFYLSENKRLNYDVYKIKEKLFEIINVFIDY